MSAVDITVDEATQVAEARRAANAAAARVGLDETRAAQVALVATELATNLVKHGGGGRLLVRAADGCVELLALDRGRGIADVAACLADGYSTAGTPGNGLGAVQRLSQSLQILSWPGAGSAVRAVVGASAGVDARDPAALQVPREGETVSGDGWSWHRDADALTVFVVDGLGHGTEAAVAANAAIEQFQRAPDAPPAEIMAAVHGAMRHTRGGAVAAARVQWRSGTVSYAGVGNIAGAVVDGSGRLRRMVSHNGTAGHNARKIQAFEYPFGDGLLIMHSDGIAGSWALDAYPGLLAAHPMLVAGVIYRDSVRRRDDATVVVARTAAA